MKQFLHTTKMSIQISQDAEMMEVIRNDFVNSKIRSLPDKRCNPELCEIDKSTLRESKVEGSFEKDYYCLTATIKRKRK